MKEKERTKGREKENTPRRAWTRADTLLPFYFHFISHHLSLHPKDPLPLLFSLLSPPLLPRSLLLSLLLRAMSLRSALSMRGTRADARSLPRHFSSSLRAENELDLCLSFSLKPSALSLLTILLLSVFSLFSLLLSSPLILILAIPFLRI